MWVASQPASDFQTLTWSTVVGWRGVQCAVQLGTVGMVWYGMVWYGMVWYGMVWYGMVWYGMVWYGMVWYGMVWYGMVWYGMVWYGMVWYGMVWYGMVWYGMVWYGMVWYGMVWYGIHPRRCPRPPPLPPSTAPHHHLTADQWYEQRMLVRTDPCANPNNICSLIGPPPEGTGPATGPGADLPVGGRTWDSEARSEIPRGLHPTSPHLTSPHLTSPHLTSPHLTSPHLTSPHLTSPHLTSPHLTSPHLTSPHLTSPHLTSTHLTAFPPDPLRSLTTHTQFPRTPASLFSKEVQDPHCNCLAKGGMLYALPAHPLGALCRPPIASESLPNRGHMRDFDPG